MLIPQQTRTVQQDDDKPRVRDRQSPVRQERVIDREVAKRASPPIAIPEHDKYPINQRGVPQLFARA